MKALYALPALWLACAAFGQIQLRVDKLALAGKTYTNCTVKTWNPAESIILFDGGGLKVKTEALPVALRQKLHYDSNAAAQYSAAQAHKKIISQAAAAQPNALPTAPNQPPYDAIETFSVMHLRDIHQSDFPTNQAVQAACKEIASELNGILAVLEVGVTYNKFADILTDKVLTIDKIKNLRGDLLPEDLLYRAGRCIHEYNESRHWWEKKISAEDQDLRRLDEYYMREHWAAAAVQTAYCNGIANKDTNANSLALTLVAKMIQDEQLSVKLGGEDAARLDPAVSGMTLEQIVERLKSKLYGVKPTNSPGSQVPGDGH